MARADDYGQLGLGDTDARRAFTRLPRFDDEHIERLVCGRYSTFVVTRSR
jgi:hypothetical protein